MRVAPVLALALIGGAVLPAYAQSDPYRISVDGHSFDVAYSVDADVVAMEIDVELNSLLVGLEGTRDSVFEIHLPDEMISAEDDDFVVLVDWVEVDHRIVEPSHTSAPEAPVTVVQFPVQDGALEVEIIGTHVIPEFPVAMIALAAVLTGVVVMSKRRGLLGRNPV